MTSDNTAGTDHVSPLWEAIARCPTQADAWLSLALRYADGTLPWQAAYSARQALRLDASLGSVLHGLLAPDRSGASVDDSPLGRGPLPDASTWIRRLSDWLEAHPGDWLSWLYLARLLETVGESPDRTRAFSRARALEPVLGESMHWMGVWRLNAGDAAGAVEALATLVDVRPLRCGSMMYLGEALFRVGKVEAAETAFSRASLSNSPDFLLLLSARVYAHNYWQEAIAVLRKAVEIKPDAAAAWLAMARIQSDVYLLADCRESLRRVLAIAPGHAEARLLDIGLLGRHGDAKGHLEALQAVYESRGGPRSRLASSIAMTSLYHDGLTPIEVADGHRRLCAPIESATSQRTVFVNARRPTRRLRVGFVTGDLHRQHPVNIFMLPVLRQLDHECVEVCIYYTGGMYDEYTRQAQGCADRWVDAASLDDPALQHVIVADAIDVLVDLAGHTSSHRLGVFAMRAAPVQATFLGYPHSTGLNAIDWIVGDATVSPAQDARLFSEGLAQMPHSVYCWAPVDDYPLAPPRTAQARVAFGSFNNAMKLSPRTIALWARILRAVPEADLLLKAPSFRDDAVQARFAQRFAEHDIAPERLRFRGPTGLEAMMQEYGDIDVALDPTPYNGGTTTLQALWMGVPVVTLAGKNFVSRMGASFMASLGQPDWCAADEDAYVRIAARLACDTQATRDGRARLRARMSASPLCDIEAYVKDFEALLRLMWSEHCEQGTRRVISLRGATNDDERPSTR